MDLTRARETLAWRTLVAILQADPVLDRTIRTWQVCKGEGGESKPFAEATLPALRLVPEFDLIRLADVDNYLEAMVVTITQGVAGTNADDRLDLWGAIRTALHFRTANPLGALPDDTTVPAGIDVRQCLRLAGVTTYTFVDPPKLVGEPLVNQVSRARLALQLFVPQ